MPLKQFKFTTSFSSLVKPLVSEEKDKFLATASLQEVGKFLPNINTAKNVDLLPVAFNACVINRPNKNDDVIDTATALAIYKEFINKPINVEHHREKVIGVILTAGFSEFGSDKPLSEEEVKNMTTPFNITLGGLVWRIVNPSLSDAIEESNDPTSNKYLSISASWELGFVDYKIIILKNGEKNIAGGRIISEAKEIEAISPNLKSLGGNGVLDDSRIYRMPVNDVLPLGIGFTEKPAAEVKGIATPPATPIIEATITGTPDCNYGICPNCQVNNWQGTMQNETGNVTCGKCQASSPAAKWAKAKDSTAHEHKTMKCSCGSTISTCRCSNSNKNVEVIEAGCTECQKNKDKISQASKLNVKIGRKQIMIKSITDITDENLKEAKAADIATFIADELKKASTGWATEKDKLTKTMEDAIAAQKTAEAASLKTAEDLKKIQASLEELQKKATEAAAVEAFNIRMTKINEAYDLDNEVRAAIVEEVKAIASDEDFGKWEKKASVLLKGFAKKTAPKIDPKTGKPVVDNTDDKDKTAKAAIEAVAALDEVISKATKEKAALTNTSTVAAVSIQEKYKAAFAADQFIVKK